MSCRVVPRSRSKNLLDLALERSSVPRFRFLSHIEGWFLTLGIVFLSIYAAAIGYARLSQIYANWTFERTLADRPISMRDFLRDLVTRRAPASREATSAIVAPRPAAPRVLPRVRPGDPVGRLSIPSLRMTLIVFEGTDAKTLARSVGHIRGTSLPGEAGNFAVAGHRDAQFRQLKNIVTGSEITVETTYGSFRYEVVSTSIVRPTDVEILASGPKPLLTLVTCYPFYFVGHAPKRFVVQALLRE
jgi:sortase A